jgi:hypothetical protein
MVILLVLEIAKPMEDRDKKRIERTKGRIVANSAIAEKRNKKAE